MPLLEMKSVTITEKGQISIPKDARKKLFKKGSKVGVFTYHNRIEIRPLSEIKNIIEKEKVETALASEKVLAKDWLTPEEDKAWESL